MEAQQPIRPSFPTRRSSSTPKDKPSVSTRTESIGCSWSDDLTPWCTLKNTTRTSSLLKCETVHPVQWRLWSSRNRDGWVRVTVEQNPRENFNCVGCRWMNEEPGVLVVNRRALFAPSFSGSLVGGGGAAERSRRDVHLEPSPRSSLPGLPHRDPGDVQNFS